MKAWIKELEELFSICRNPRFAPRCQVPSKVAGPRAHRKTTVLAWAGGFFLISRQSCHGMGTGSSPAKLQSWEGRQRRDLLKLFCSLHLHVSFFGLKSPESMWGRGIGSHESNYSPFRKGSLPAPLWTPAQQDHGKETFSNSKWWVCFTLLPLRSGQIQARGRVAPGTVWNSLKCQPMI